MSGTTATNLMGLGMAADLANQVATNLSPSMPAATVTGAATIGGALGVASTATIGGAATFSKTATITGAATLSSTLAVTGASTLTGSVSMGAGLSLTGTPTVGGTVYYPAGTTISAGAGGGKANATTVAAGTAIVVLGTVATALDSMLLPAATATGGMWVHNAGAKNAAVFPTSGETILTVGTVDTASTLNAGTAAQFVPLAAKSWTRIG